MHNLLIKIMKDIQKASVLLLMMKFVMVFPLKRKYSKMAILLMLMQQPNIMVIMLMHLACLC